MNKEQIEKIIENLSKQGYHLVNKTIKDDLIKLDFGDCKFTFNFTPKNEQELEATLKELLESYN